NYYWFKFCIPWAAQPVVSMRDKLIHHSTHCRHQYHQQQRVFDSDRAIYGSWTLLVPLARAGTVSTGIKATESKKGAAQP
ncbi:hypothetical protein A2U01_0023712, partial [Trifolium medium]|nr:hypothetical protein [Trifolium medium]